MGSIRRKRVFNEVDYGAAKITVLGADQPR